STGQFRVGATNDGHMSWTTSAPVVKGTVIYATNTTVNGSSTGVSGQLGGATAYFNTSGDQLIVYQGTLGTASGATFIYAVNTGQSSLYSANGAWITSGSSIITDQASYLPPGLNSTTSVALTSSTGNTSSG